jgi:hypothetical protein
VDLADLGMLTLGKEALKQYVVGTVVDTPIEEGVDYLTSGSAQNLEGSISLWSRYYRGNGDQNAVVVP